MLRTPKFTTRSVPGDFEVVLLDHEGTQLVIEGTALITIPMTIAPPNDTYHGMSRADDHYSCAMSPARFRCNGADGVGHLELSMLNQLVESS